MQDLLVDAVLPAVSSAIVKSYLLPGLYNTAGKVDIFNQIPEKVYTVETSSSPAIKKTDNPGDLPEYHFIRLTPEESVSKKNAKWHDVKDLDDNDPKKILYFRRFEGEFRSPVSLSPELAEAMRREDFFQYYALDGAQRVKLSAVSPYTTQLLMPPGVKIGIVIGYHHLEKPWGHLFKEMFEKQVRFPHGSVQFIVIQNGDIPNGDPSVSSEREIQDAVMREGLTHIIDVHEQLSHLNHYMDYSRASEFNDSFRSRGIKNSRGQEYTLDPFVPLWAIEQYYSGYIYPQLQYAVNEQIKKIEILVGNIGEVSSESSFPGDSSSSVSSSVSSLSIVALSRLGGIDFRALPVVTRAITNLGADISSSRLSRLKDMSLNREWQQIENMVKAGIAVSPERIKGYLQASSALNDDLSKDREKVIILISNILRQDEGNGYKLTNPVLRDILVVLDAMSQTSDLKQVFLGKNHV